MVGSNNIVRLSIKCPKCGDDIIHEFEGSEGLVAVECYANDEWECDSCGTVMYFDEFDLTWKVADCAYYGWEDIDSEDEEYENEW